tara:strand:- start:425 stop:901 length:477 start_codon:yes stop_codon:yes gene_type:complete
MERQNLNLSQWLWWTERDSILIAYYDAGSDKFTSPSSADAGNNVKINILFVQRPTPFLVTGETDSTGRYTGTDEYNKVALDGGAMPESSYLDQVCEIPEQFHEALVSRAIANGYERAANTIPLSQHFHNKYEKGVKEAKTYSIRGRDGTLNVIRPMDF